MKKKNTIIGLLAILAVGITGCFKDEAEELREKEDIKLEIFISDLENKGISVEKTELGLYYVVDSAGKTDPPLLGDYVEVNYTGRVLDGVVFETTSEDSAQKHDITRNLYGPVRLRVGYGYLTGFNLGLQMMGEEAHYQLIIPSNIGLGGASYSNIPPYSTLIYDVEMVNVINDPAAHEREVLNNYLAEVGIDPKDSTNSGLYFQWMEESASDTVKAFDVVGVKYKGMLTDGRIIDQTEEDKSYKFVAGNRLNIEGFDEGILKMTLGSKARFVIPYYLGYGFDGYLSIPLFSTLIYEVEVVSIE